MDEIIQNLINVSNTIRSLFADKSELCGLNDWDSIIGCIMLIESSAKELSMMQIDKTPQSEVEADGE